MIIICLKDGNGISLVAIVKHPSTHTKAMPKYVAPNLRGPKLVYGTIKKWMIVCRYHWHWRLDSIEFLLFIMCWVKYWSLMQSYPNAKPRIIEVQKCYNIQVSYSSCWWFIGYIYLMACKNLSWSLQIDWSWSNRGISLVDYFI